VVRVSVKGCSVGKGDEGEGGNGGGDARGQCEETA
jgi:hypothetical protein